MATAKLDKSSEAEEVDVGSEAEEERHQSLKVRLNLTVIVFIFLWPNCVLVVLSQEEILDAELEEYNNQHKKTNK